jgi:hypothetical protein
MIRLQEQQIKGNEKIEQVEFQKSFIFRLRMLPLTLNEDLSNVKYINLLDKKFATIQQINDGRIREPLSHFNEMLLKGKNFKK